MKTKEQRVAIAEACGWSEVREESGEDVDFDARSVCPWTGLRGARPKDRVRAFVPRYLEDLNAMHEAEKTLPKDLHRTYYHHLTVMRVGRVLPFMATADERAEAFLRTLGKWN